MKICTKCGKNEKEVELNIEGSIHHGRPILCQDRKKCEKRSKKQKR